MKKIYCLLGSVLLSLSSGLAQENHLRNSKWFAYGAQVDFAAPNSGSFNGWREFPQADTNPFTEFIVTSVCDQSGNPLIAVKSSGSIWVKGQNLGAISINTWNVIIVPKPNHPDRYFIVISNEVTGLNYTEVDLINSVLINNQTPLTDLNGVPILSSPGGSGIASTINANGTDYWITAFADDNILSYQVTENGVNATPSSAYYISPSPLYPEETLKIKISPQTNYNQKFIAVVNYYTGVSLKNFNDDTGEITENYSDENPALQLRGDYWNNNTYTKDAEFSSDGNTLYCVDYWSTYAIQKNSSDITTIDNFSTFIALQRGPDDDLYFVDVTGYLNQLDFNDSSLNKTSVQLFSTGWQQWAHLPPLVSVNQCLASAPTPSFNLPAYICKGTTLTFPTTSLDGITGSWSPAPNNIATTTYTFTAGPGQCAANITNVTVVVNDQNTIPTFSGYPIYLPTALCVGSSYTFPTTSTNNISGTWSPAYNNSATTTYTFTPNSAQCGATTTNTITINQKVIPPFDAIGPICSGGSFTLPTHTDTSNGTVFGIWSPVINNTATTTYIFTPYSGQCSQTTTMTVTVNPFVTPTFDAIPYVCSGISFSPLPTTSNNGIIGTWSPAFNNTAATTYTFTPNTGQCITGSPQTMTIAVNAIITPIFTQVQPIYLGDTVTLPTTSNNGISGTWDLTADYDTSRVYTFTPTPAACATTTTMTITVDPNLNPSNLHVDTSFKDDMNMIFGNLDISKMPDIVLDYGIDFEDLSDHNGTLTDDNVMHRGKYVSIYNTLLTARVRTRVPGLIDPVTFKSNWNSLRQPNKIVLSGLFYKYSQFKDDALGNTINMIDGQLYDIYDSRGVWQNPYDEKQVFAVSGPILIYNDLSMQVQLPSSLWYTNQWDSVASIAIDFGDGQGYQPADFDEIKNINYTEAGMYEWIYMLTLSDGQILYAHSKIQVNGIDFVRKSYEDRFNE